MARTNKVFLVELINIDSFKIEEQPVKYSRAIVPEKKESMKLTPRNKIVTPGLFTRSKISGIYK